MKKTMFKFIELTVACNPPTKLRLSEMPHVTITRPNNFGIYLLYVVQFVGLIFGHILMIHGSRSAVTPSLTQKLEHFMQAPFCVIYQKVLFIAVHLKIGPRKTLFPYFSIVL